MDGPVVVPAVIVKVVELELAPPGFSTVTVALPAFWIRVLGTCAVNCVAVLDRVVKVVPFHCTVEFETKPVPFIVKVNATLPAGTEVGLNEEIAGDAVVTTVRLIKLPDLS
jgi:hypothetical protein